MLVDGSSTRDTVDRKGSWVRPAEDVVCKEGSGHALFLGVLGYLMEVRKGGEDQPEFGRVLPCTLARVPISSAYDCVVPLVPRHRDSQFKSSPLKVAEESL